MYFIFKYDFLNKLWVIKYLPIGLGHTCTCTYLDISSDNELEEFLQTSILW